MDARAQGRETAHHGIMSDGGSDVDVAVLSENYVSCQQRPRTNDDPFLHYNVRTNPGPGVNQYRKGLHSRRAKAAHHCPACGWIAKAHRQVKRIGGAELPKVPVYRESLNQIRCLNIRIHQKPQHTPGRAFPILVDNDLQDLTAKPTTSENHDVAQLQHPNRIFILVMKPITLASSLSRAAAMSERSPSRVSTAKGISGSP